MTKSKAPSTKKAGTKAPTRKTPAAETTKKPVARWVRNLHNMPVHLRLHTTDSERPFFVNLQPRGRLGDAERVPAAATESRQFIDAVQNSLVEIITQTELNKIAYPSVGYTSPVHQVIVRPADRDASSTPDWDGKGRPPQHDPNAARRPISARFTPAPEGTVGAMPGAEAVPQLITDDRKVGADDMLPAGTDVTSRKVIVERVR